jgi:hypothetical protein
MSRRPVPALILALSVLTGLGFSLPAAGQG